MVPKKKRRVLNLTTKNGENLLHLLVTASKKNTEFVYRTGEMSKEIRRLYADAPFTGLEILTAKSAFDKTPYDLAENIPLVLESFTETKDWVFPRSKHLIEENIYLSVFNAGVSALSAGAVVGLSLAPPESAYSDGILILSTGALAVSSAILAARNCSRAFRFLRNLKQREGGG